MKFTETLPGAWLVEIEPHCDDRGFFARTVCIDEFSAVGLNATFVQQSVSWSPHTGTLRGLHYQNIPHQEEKLVRVTRGAVFDVIADIRAGSATRGKWFGVELSAEDHRQLYIPMGFAHGFQTLVPDTEVLYEMTARYHQQAARGIRWDDPSLAIEWPRSVDPTDPRRVSAADAKLPTLDSL